MFLNGQKVDFKGPKDAQEAGIAAVYQHPTSYPHLTVAENIFMGHEIIKHHMIQWKEMNQEANKYLKELDADLTQQQRWVHFLLHSSRWSRSPRHFHKCEDHHSG